MDVAAEPRRGVYAIGFTRHRIGSGGDFKMDMGRHDTGGHQAEHVARSDPIAGFDHEIVQVRREGIDAPMIDHDELWTVGPKPNAIGSRIGHDSGLCRMDWRAHVAM